MKFPQDKKRLAWLAGSIWMLATLVAVGTYWKPFTPQLTKHGLIPEYDENGHVIGHHIPDISEADKEKFIQKARDLRERWRPWAQAHRADLQRMLDARADDTVAYQEVSLLLPDPLQAIKTLGVEPQDIGIHLQPEEKGAPFPWEGIQMHWAPEGQTRVISTKFSSNPKVAAIEAYIPKAIKVKNQGFWQAKRDIVLLGGDSGLTETLLWASGRITQRTYLVGIAHRNSLRKVQAAGRSPQESDIKSPFKEIEPIFDFLRPNPTLS